MPELSEVVVVPTPRSVTSVFGSVVPLRVTVVSLVVLFVSAVVPAESKAVIVGVAGATAVRVTVEVRWLVELPAPARTVKELEPTVTLTLVKL